MAKDKRVEVLFDPAEYRVLEDAAHRRGKAVGAVIREAVAKYVTGPTQKERQDALDRLLAIDGGPVGSPEDIKATIIKGLDDYLDRKLTHETD